MFKNTLKTTVLLAGLGGLIVAVAAMLGAARGSVPLQGTRSAALVYSAAVGAMVVSRGVWTAATARLVDAELKDH